MLAVAYYKAPIVYVEGDEVPPETEAFIKENKGKFTKAIIYAGISDVAKSHLSLIR